MVYDIMKYKKIIFGNLMFSATLNLMLSPLMLTPVLYPPHVPFSRFSCVSIHTSKLDP